MTDIRQQLLAAKKDIEEKSGHAFPYESIALADLISAFVAIKVADQIKNLKPVSLEEAFAIDKPIAHPVKRLSDDFLYGQ